MLRPKARIRRFDVFAEYNRLKALEDGMDEDEAKGYALWLAKIVAARRFSSGLVETRKPRELREAVPVERGEEPKRKFRSLSGIEQTDALFDKEIVQRMGPDFYENVFAPAIREAFAHRRSYVSIRDSIRQDWVP